MNYCSRCGKKLNINDKFCSSCGIPIGNVMMPQPAVRYHNRIVNYRLVPTVLQNTDQTSDDKSKSGSEDPENIATQDDAKSTEKKNFPQRTIENAVSFTANKIGGITNSIVNVLEKVTDNSSVGATASEHKKEKLPSPTHAELSNEDARSDENKQRAISSKQEISNTCDDDSEKRDYLRKIDRINKRRERRKVLQVFCGVSAFLQFILTVAAVVYLTETKISPMESGIAFYSSVAIAGFFTLMICVLGLLIYGLYKAEALFALWLIIPVSLIVPFALTMSYGELMIRNVLGAEWMGSVGKLIFMIIGILNCILPIVLLVRGETIEDKEIAMKRKIIEEYNRKKSQSR